MQALRKHLLQQCIQRHVFPALGNGFSNPDPLASSGYARVAYPAEKTTSSEARRY